MRRSNAIFSALAAALVGAVCLQAQAAKAPDQAATVSKALSAPAPLETATSAPAAADGRALLNRYCVSCHSTRLKTAGLVLDTLDVADVAGHAEIWEKVIRKVRSNAMPPPGLPRPDRKAAVNFIQYLETAHDRAAQAHPNPGRTVVHRLNRAEYTNAIRDLLGLDVDGRSLLFADDADKNGFDNNADVLSVSPALMERYMSAARRISRLAIGRQATNPLIETYNVPRMQFQDGRMDEDLPFGTRGGLAIRHRFPVDGEYSLKIKLQTNLYDYIKGLGKPHQLEVRVDGVRVTVFTVGGEQKGTPAPAGFAGAIFGSPEWEDYSHQADKGLEARFSVKAGARVVGVSFFGESSTVAEGVLQPRQVGYPLAVNEMQEGAPAIDSVQIGGPYAPQGPGDTPTRRKIFVCRPSNAGDEKACAEKILSTLARRAYRRPVTGPDAQALLDFYSRGRQSGDFEAGIQLGLERILDDPEFIFRAERDPGNVAPGAAYQVSDLELASRLSFFLWSSLPDDELLDLAVRGKLRDPKVLEGQVRRMFADDRARQSLIANFAGQWLMLRNVDAHVPNTDLFHEFDENLRQAMKRETELFIDDQLASDRPLIELLTAKYTFLNERLARHYQIPNVTGERFRKIELDNASPRMGLLGQASILTVTSYPDRTSPVLRGKWVLENMLAAPPPAPPPDVPALKDKGKDGRPATVRERLEIHRANPSCSSCHSQMDPLGFALENFDAIGMWRMKGEDGAVIDAGSALPDGTKLDGPAGLRNLLLRRQDEFVEAITEKLMAYALGRSVQYYDYPAIRSIIRETAATNHSWSSVVVAMVKSVPFQMRRSDQ
jgi:mono/diheme cytochrome c family protein